MDSIAPEFNFKRYERELRAASDGAALYSTIVNAPFVIDKVASALIFLGIIGFLMVSKEEGTINRLAITNNEFAQGGLDVMSKRYQNIKIPISHQKNIVAQSIKKQIVTKTNDFAILFTPELTAEQARIVQAGTGAAYSSVYPLIGVKDGGALIFSFYQYPEHIGHDQVAFMEHYSSLISKVLRSRLS